MRYSEAAFEQAACALMDTEARSAGVHALTGVVSRMDEEAVAHAAHLS
jgi:hypothetical protein